MEDRSILGQLNGTYFLYLSSSPSSFLLLFSFLVIIFFNQPSKRAMDYIKKKNKLRLGNTTTKQ